MKAITEILNTTTAKKMVANLSFSYELNKSNFSEFNFIDELPLKQQELFDTIYQLLDYNRVELALMLIQNKLTFKN
ncbi:hypothetical protein tooticki91_gp009 [Flavobacterium phage vB_FspS_tooticki9-1]|uniref:Uncharacterized protein n=25 Tax=Caudoviricetes TaxID=2731619 RepID=A0A6B9LG97_9CAUD|nr:hypothetical protein HWC87_gp15 [Flavobacterium phage vB_FspS_filifjonk9-1]YP_009854667.1 hypothetical protein HWC88_gp15 [Flavobacterium phage vB_FspS_hattifnatt9-1]YP_009854876.1 hypothetical protein HWC91_gp21 [Flavobacterium phage vB_FspS_lillamy9-1]YP_009855012.1 hypothetical protein HWC93_gp11 [Flavobacterium phage vB_FspS_mumin9-1]YP_009855080.1 hypothetical protein HWC94_gp12 [Flavobacterium phage vB_FspS_mymlan6-1]YP_009855159.1 hypothetical protein HWC95_gp23 [Flavobacterium phage